MKKNKEFKTLFSLLKEHKVKLIICAIFIALCNTTYIFVGYLNGSAIESVTNKKLQSAIMYLSIYLVMEIITNLIARISYRVLSQEELKISRKMSLATFKKAMALPSYAYEEKKSGELINRITNDTEIIISSFSSILISISNILTTIILIVYICFNSIILGVEILIFLIIYYFVVKYFVPKLREMHAERKIINDEYSSLVTETVRGIREVKTLGIKQSLFNKSESIINKLTKKSDEELIKSQHFDVIGGILKSLIEVTVFVTCAVLLYNGKLTLTFFIAVTYYIYRISWAIENISSLTKTYNKTLIALTRINEVLDNKLYSDVEFGNIKLTNCDGVIEFKNVNFGYPNEKITLNDFNVKFDKNKKIAVVGKSGQGKSTLFNLITRIFDVISGSITIDNINVKDLTEESLRNNISIIRQEPFLFNMSIKDNFKFLDKSITLDEIRGYCKMAFIDEYIMSLPDKYETILGESGVNLSGGQKQRLAIARALAKKSKIILFDEATSALDNESQSYIKKSIDNLVKDHTVIIIAHRLSTIIDADIIYVVDKGKVVDNDTHKNLLKNSNIYKKLYEEEK